MLALIGSFPQQCREAREIGRLAGLPRSFKRRYQNIVCTGLGGSAIGADIARSYIADDAATPLFVNRNYILPRFVGPNTLVITSSYSGNTEETLSAYGDARAKRARIVAITSGGKLKKRADADGFPVVVIPGGLPPRCALGYSFFPLLAILAKTGVIQDRTADIDEAIKVMGRLRDGTIGPAVTGKRNVAKAVARQLCGKFPVIYGGQDHIDAVVTRWRGQIAENAKTLGSSHVFPEMNHNEIVGWDNPKALLKDFVAVILRDAGDHPRIARRIDVTETILKKSGAAVIEVHSSGASLLARIFSLVYTGDFVSYYLAILNGRDPTPVERIAYLKRELGKR